MSLSRRKACSCRWTIQQKSLKTLQWRHSDREAVPNHQPYDCLLNRLFRHRWKETSKLRVTGLCAGNSPVTGEFPAQRASNAESVSIWWRHRESYGPCDGGRAPGYGCLVTWFCSQMIYIYIYICIAKPGIKTAATRWPDPDDWPYEEPTMFLNQLHTYRYFRCLSSSPKHSFPIEYQCIFHYFRSTKCIWKCRLQNVGHFVQAMY